MIPNMKFYWQTKYKSCKNEVLCCSTPRIGYVHYPRRNSRQRLFDPTPPSPCPTPFAFSFPFSLWVAFSLSLSLSLFYTHTHTHTQTHTHIHSHTHTDSLALFFNRLSLISLSSPPCVLLVPFGLRLSSFSFHFFPSHSFCLFLSFSFTHTNSLSLSLSLFMFLIDPLNLSLLSFLCSAGAFCSYYCACAAICVLYVVKIIPPGLPPFSFVHVHSLARVNECMCLTIHSSYVSWDAILERVRERDREGGRERERASERKREGKRRGGNEKKQCWKRKRGEEGLGGEEERGYWDVGYDLIWMALDKICIFQLHHLQRKKLRWG